MSSPRDAITSAQMQLVLDVSRKLSITSDLDTLLLCIKDNAERLLECERATIWLHDMQSDELWTKVASGLTAGQIRIPARTGVAGAAFRDGELLHVSDPYSDSRFNPDTDRRTGFKTRNILATRMIDIEGRPVGVVQAINTLHDDFATADHDLLQLLAAQAGVAIQRWHLQQQAMESLVLRKEMELARSVQEAMIPKCRPDVPGLEAVGWMKPASVNGGDCFDLWKLPDGRLGVFVADASGHGIAPALVVLQTRTLVRTLSETEPRPLDLMRRVNARIADDMVPGRFVTAFLAFVSPDTGAIDWISAGHAPILLRRGDSLEITSLDATAPPLGIMHDLMADEAEPAEIKPGDALIVTTDGITESFNPHNELYGTERLCAALQSADTCPDAILETMKREMLEWQTKDEPHDDQTVVVVRRG